MSVPAARSWTGSSLERPHTEDLAIRRAPAPCNAEMIRQREQRIPLGRGAQPDDIAEAILFMASDAAGAINGEILSVDGGTLAMSSGYSPPRDAT